MILDIQILNFCKGSYQKILIFWPNLKHSHLKWLTKETCEHEIEHKHKHKHDLLLWSKTERYGEMVYLEII